MYVYVYIYRERDIPQDYPRSENNSAICLLLGILLRGFPLQTKLFQKHRMPKNNTNMIAQRNSFRKEIPSWGSRAGNVSQISCPSFPSKYIVN